MSTRRTTAGNPTTTRETTTTQPPLNETEYPVVRRRIGGWSDEFESHDVRLLTSADWERKLPEDELSSTETSFLADTDFAAESVIAVGGTLSGSGNRWILASVNGVGSETVEVHLREWDADTGLQESPWRLLLVRIPNRGTIPASVDATLEAIAGTEEVSTDDAG